MTPEQILELYIRIKDGQPFEHPILADNFREAFPDVDTNNLPEGFARFVRVAPPAIGPYELYGGCSYELINGVYTDVHNVESMTPEQIEEKKTQRKDQWTANGGFASWIFNDEICEHEPPIPYPNDGKNYRWDEPTTSWVEVLSV